MTLKNALMVGSETQTGTYGGWTESDAREAAIEARLEQHRYASDEDRILARYEDVPALFPSYEELQALGITNLDQLADALDNGLSATLFGTVLGQGLDAEMFNLSLAAGIDNIPQFNEGMEHLVDQHALVTLHADPLDRAMHVHGECACAQ